MRVVVKERAAVSADLEQTAEYRSLSPLAVLGLILGLCAPLAFLSPLLVIVPLAGIFSSLVALRQIGASDGSIVGRPAAIVGLALSTVCAIAIPAQAIGVRWLMSRQAQPIALEWFELLAHDDPYSALELKIEPGARHPLGTGLREFYAKDEPANQRLREFVADPAVRTLLALGDRATVRHYDDVEVVAQPRGMHDIVQNYVVTYRETPDAEPTSFFVQVGLRKLPADFSSEGGWQIMGHKGGIHPEP